LMKEWLYWTGDRVTKHDGEDLLKLICTGNMNLTRFLILMAVGRKI